MTHWKIKALYFALVAGFAFVLGCSSGGEEPRAVDEKTLAEVGLPGALRPAPEPSATPGPQEPLSEGSGGKFEDHPNVNEQEYIDRDVFVPEEIKDKWKAVKLLIRNKKDESLNEVKTVNLGETVTFAGGKMKMKVGPFFPNFVMDKRFYTSMNNQLINPAVQLEVEENGKVIYKGWAFGKFPTLYAFEHDTYALQLMDSIPANVS